ncbi:hypothetical protein HSX10_03695 [Winogradskyella undariae]|uniref:hypothetical protein n=1 Tax=Winogradskyella undariae TaxID=1285465 RepID=UPI00156A98D6|nr:hypothetical protein [Winogradskyella undariae]
MNKITDIKKYLKEIVGANPNLPIKATVTAVQAEQCDVELEGGLKLTNVKLKATVTDGDDFMIAYPKVGSKVLLISLSGELDNLTVIKVDDVEKVHYKQNGLEVFIDSTDGKVAIQNNDVSFHEFFTDLYDLLKTFKVFTPAGPSGTPLPPTVLKIEGFKTKFNKILKAV